MAKNRKVPYYPRPNAKGRTTWQKGLTKNDHPSLLIISQKMNGRKRPDLIGKCGPKKGTTTGKAKTEEGELLRRQKISKALKGRPGHHTHRRGKGKRGIYRGIWCDSSWELAWILYHIHFTKIKFIRNYERFEYEFEGFKRLWVPDFKYQMTNEYVEIKGHMDTKDIAKIACFKAPLIVFGVKEMTPILNVVKAKFGKDFTNLYDLKILKKEGVIHYNAGIPRSEETKRKISETHLRKSRERKDKMAP